MIDVCTLGTCGMMPMPGRWLSCALVRCGSNLVLIDCGEGTQVPWKTLGWGFRQLGAICLTHMHADHVAGLPGILFMVAHAGRTEPLEIYGPIGTTYVVEGLRRIAADLPFPIHIHELKSGAHFEMPGELHASCCSTAHGVPCLAYRLELRRKPVFLPGKPARWVCPFSSGQNCSMGKQLSTMDRYFARSRFWANQGAAFRWQ